MNGHLEVDDMLSNHSTTRINVLNYDLYCKFTSPKLQLS